MPGRTCRYRISRIGRLLVFCSFFALIFFVTASSASARSTERAVDGPTILRVNIGFDEQYQDGNWVPVQVALSNNGADFSGKVSIRVPSSSYSRSNGSDSTSTYQEPVSLPPGSHKQVTLYVPLSLGTQGNRAPVTVELLDSTDHRVTSKTSSPNSINTNTIIVGILSTQPNNFGMLNSALSSALNVSIIQTKILTATTFPTKAEILRNFDAIVLDNFTTQTLSQDQIAALQSWVNQGGVLIATGGPEWQRTLGDLPKSLLPFTITGTDTLPPGTHLLPMSGPPKGNQQANNDELQSPVTISVARPQAESVTLLNSGNIPLITQTIEGQGSVFYLAYDPALEPFVGWPNTSKLWSGLILRALGDQILSNSAGTNPSWQGGSYGSTMDALLKSFFPNAYPPTWLILALLLSYILLLGPIRFILIRRLKKRDWSWRIVLTIIVVFTLLSYGLALQQKGTSIVSSSISVIQLNRPDTTGSAAHITTYIGVFVPNQGDFTVHIPGANLVQPGDQSQYQPYSYRGQGAAQQTIVQSVATGTNVDLKGVDIWTARTLVSKHDLRTTGGITSNLSLQGNIIRGTVTNTLPYALNDIYVLAGNDYIALGNLQSNSTKQVSLQLTGTATNTQANGQQQSIADQIASKQGIAAGPYSSYTNTNLSQDEPHRHAAMLEVLGGGYCDGNGPCYRSNTTQVVPVNGTLTRRLLYSNTSAHDPLLLTGSPATLIGWTQTAADPASNVTINGQTLNGTRETLIQAPLDVHYSGNIRIPTSFVTSQISDIQQEQNGGGIQESSPGIYNMPAGSMTFEYTLPGIPRLQKSALTFRASSNPARASTQGAGTTTDINHIQTHLYNWQTKQWESLLFNQFVLSVNDANRYIGPGNRVLLNLTNSDTNAGTAIFDMPTLEMQASVSS